MKIYRLDGFAAVSLSCFILLVLFIPQKTIQYEFNIYRVVVDPGHGGFAMYPREEHGDRFDLLSGTYLDIFREGASYRGYHEHAHMYNVARKVDELLACCAPGGDYGKFYRILKKYTDEEPARVYISHMLSRGDSRDRDAIKSREDPNAEFRLFDYPDGDGTMRPGRISRINRFSPHLVVSLHLGGWAPRYYRGLNAVIVPPYKFMHKGLEYLRGDRSSTSFFFNQPYRDWFVESVRRSGFSWFKNDVSMYFTGFRTKPSGAIDTTAFRGYRYNMVGWKYNDGPGWCFSAKFHKHNTRYADTYKGFKPEGAFWEREKSKYEEYRRGNGPEGYGGDNLYASNELIRYILYSLGMRGIRHRDHRVAPPYISIWSLPLHVNAITAFLEVGYLNRPHTRYLLNSRSDEIAEGIAVGIYSLFAGIKPRERKVGHVPNGKRIDLEKYRMTNEIDYFQSVTVK
ncbi:MAG: hypothetical protein ACOCX9_00885 [Spirochaetota bacterium]